jgi:hypothetical protein
MMISSPEFDKLRSYLGVSKELDAEIRSRADWFGAGKEV